MCKKASLLKTTSNDPSAYLRGPGLICLNVANSLRLFFFANLWAVSITKCSGSIPSTDLALYFFIKWKAAPPQPQPISRIDLPSKLVFLTISSISSVPPGERNPSPHTTSNKFNCFGP